MIFSFLHLSNCDLSLKGWRQTQRYHWADPDADAEKKEWRNEGGWLEVYTLFIHSVNVSFPSFPLGQLLSYMFEYTGVYVTMASIVTMHWWQWSFPAELGNLSFSGWRFHFPLLYLFQISPLPLQSPNLLSLQWERQGWASYWAI